MFKQLKILLLSLFVSGTLNAVDLVVFSYNRPMQLYALLESCEVYLANRASTTVLYRVSGPDYQAGYDLVQARFSDVKFILQKNAPHDFKNLVHTYAFEQTSSPYIMFAVDDLFVKAPVDLQACVQSLEQFNAYTFSLRLSPNIKYCYILNKTMGIPRSVLIMPEIYKHCFKDGKYDWAYPNCLDMNIYRKSDIYTNMMRGNWNNPNTLEGVWAAGANLNQTGLYFSESKIVNIPINIVQTSWTLRAMNSYSTQELLTRFMQGQKIDIAPISSFQNNSVHTNFDINFI